MSREMEMVPMFQMGWQLNWGWVSVIVSKLSALPFLKNIREAERKDTVLFSFTAGLLPWDEACEGKLAEAPAAVGNGGLPSVGINFKWDAEEFLR